MLYTHYVCTIYIHTEPGSLYAHAAPKACLVSSQVRPRHSLSTVLVNACRWQAACAQEACLLAYQLHQHLVDMWWASGSASLLHWQHHNTDKALYWLELRPCCMTASYLFARAAYLLGDKERACCCVSSRPRVAAWVVEGRVGVQRDCTSLWCRPYHIWSPYAPNMHHCRSSVETHEPHQQQPYIAVVGQQLIYTGHHTR